MDYNNIPKGLKLTTQIPLDVKTYVADEATLAYLGTGDNLAYTYYDGLRVFCIAERTNYEWREVQAGEENEGLVTLDFTYPAGLTAFGIDYSNKKYNFFPFTFTGANGLNGINAIMALYTSQCINVSQALVGDFVTLNFGSPIYNLGWKIGTRVRIHGSSSLFLEGIVSSVITNPVSSINVNIDLVVGSGNFCDFNIVITGNPGANGADGSDGLDYTANNLQRTITTFSDGSYELQSTDNNHTLIIETDGSNIFIGIPATGLPEKFAVAFIQKGTGDVRIDGYSGVTVNSPIQFADTIKGPNYFAYLEREGTSNVYYLGGNIKV